LSDEQDVRNKHEKTTLLDEMDEVTDENKLWQTPSASRNMVGGTIYTLLNVVISVFFTILTIILAQAPVEESSVYYTIENFNAMLRIFATLGFTGAGAKFLSEYRVRDRTEARIHAISACKYNFIIIGLPIIALSFVLYLTVPTNPREQLAYFVLFLTTIVDRLCANPTIYIMGYNRYDLIAYSSFVPTGLHYIASMFLFPIFGYLGPVFSMLIMRIVQYFWSSYYAVQVSGFPFRDEFAWGKEYGHFRKMVSFNFLYSFANLVYALLTTTLLLTLGKILNVLTPQEITGIATLSTYANVVMNIFGIVGPLQTSVSEAHSLRNPKLVENYTFTVIKVPIYMIIAYILFIIFFAPELITIFYGARWVTMGFVVLTALLPAYTLGSFAANYDAILSGVWRPEAPVIPWFLALLVAIIGIICAQFLPPDVFVSNAWFQDNGTLINFGVTTRFVFLMVVINVAFIIASIWIVRVCLKVLNVHVPKDFLWKPLLAGGVTAAFLMLIRPFAKDGIIGLLGDPTVGGIAYIIVMAIVGILLYLFFSIIFDALTIEDGKFWLHIFGSMGPAGTLLKPLFWLGKKCMRLKIIHGEPYHWVTTTDRAQLESEMLFDVDHELTIPEEVTPDQEYLAHVTIRDLREKMFDCLVYAKLDYRILESSVQYLPTLAPGTLTVDVRFSIPKWAREGLHEIYLVVKMFNRPNPKVSREQLINGYRWKFFDYRLMWLHEDILYTRVVPVKVELV